MSDIIGVVMGVFVSISFYLIFAQYIHGFSLYLYSIITFFLVAGGIISIIKSEPKSEDDYYQERI